MALACITKLCGRVASSSPHHISPLAFARYPWTRRWTEREHPETWTSNPRPSEKQISSLNTMTTTPIVSIQYRTNGFENFVIKKHSHLGTSPPNCHGKSTLRFPFSPTKFFHSKPTCLFTNTHANHAKWYQTKGFFCLAEHSSENQGH